MCRLGPLGESKPRLSHRRGDTLPGTNMEKFSNDGLTHDSGKEFNAQAASNKPIIKQIAESICEKIREGQYEEYSRYDGFGIYYLTEVKVVFPMGIEFNPEKDVDYEELDSEIDRILYENSFTYYHTSGGVVPEQGDTEFILYLYDDRRPPVSWDEEEANEKGYRVISTGTTGKREADGLPF